MNNLSAVVKKLQADIIRNLNILGFIKHNPVHGVKIDGGAVLVRGVSDRVWTYISCSNKDDLLEIKGHLSDEDKFFAAADEWMIDPLLEGRVLIWDFPADQYYLPEEAEIPEPEIRILPLKQEDAQTVFENSEYKDYLSLEYTVDRIKRGINAGVYENNRLVSWATTQDDGAMGFLHTLDAYRRRGYGYNITLSLIHQLRRAGEIPFAHIKRDNYRSAKLLLKLGFKKNKTLHWFEATPV